MMLEHKRVSQKACCSLKTHRALLPAGKTEWLFRERGCSKHSLVMFFWCEFRRELFSWFMGSRPVLGPHLCWFRAYTWAPKGLLEGPKGLQREKVEAKSYPNPPIWDKALKNITCKKNANIRHFFWFLTVGEGLESVLDPFMLILVKKRVPTGTLFFLKRKVLEGAKPILTLNGKRGFVFQTVADARISWSYCVLVALPARPQGTAISVSIC